MNLYVLTQTERTGYDTYDSCLVCAENEYEARNINPSSSWESSAWASEPSKVMCRCVGKASPDVKEGIIVSSFNAR